MRLSELAAAIHGEAAVMILFPSEIRTPEFKSLLIILSILPKTQSFFIGAEDDSPLRGYFMPKLIETLAVPMPNS
ncbi:MAG: hypothetical protein OXC63_12950 [Aestuariivita sp.]|nr:hypothetical protein [Aestuariivita sp.]MCY4289486.1 hypothetical protein [Aestuariivita sp.]